MSNEISERDAAKFLQRIGFFHHPDGRITYMTETGQQVRVLPKNEARWRADVNRRRDAHLGKYFHWTMPTAESMMARWDPARRAEIEQLKRDAAHKQQLEMAALLSFNYGKYIRRGF